MPRWEGNSQSRLEEAALSLFAEQGYDATSVAEITRRAGLTERSFYRWFPDKREVLFGGVELSAVLVKALESVPLDVAALPALITAFGSATEILRPRGFLIRRAAVVNATPALQERELSKLDALARALEDALTDRGIDDGEARLTVDIGMAVLRSATQQWIDDETVELTQALAHTATRLSGIATTIRT